MTAVVIGYARVSTEDQNLDLQRDALTRAGRGRIYEDRISGAKAARPGLALALEVARSGDHISISIAHRYSAISDCILEGFPDLAHDDEVDTCSGALEMLNVPIKGWAMLEYYRLRAQELAEQRKPQPAPPANPAPGSLEWQAEQNKSS